MGLNQYSDYSSGSSSSSSSPWMSQARSSFPRAKSENLDVKSSSYNDLVSGRCTLEDVMREFQMNGSDSPYNPEEDKIWSQQPEINAIGALSGMGPASVYLRQKSCPASQRSAPAQRLPRPRSLYEPAWTGADFDTSTPMFDVVSETPGVSSAAPAQQNITLEQMRVLGSLPDGVVYALLRYMHYSRRAMLPKECRFCKNNGERESYFRSHTLKDASGRVACPVLRAFRCARCGAAGDRAHTIKYCPLSTDEERIKSAAMMRSVRMASGRRRHMPAAAADAAPYAAATSLTPYGAAPPLAPDQSYGDTPLDPLWAALERKLMI